MVYHTQNTFTSLKIIDSSCRDGPDGPWASFNMTVSGTGSKEDLGQTFRTFPGLSFSILLVPIAAEFCSGSRILEESCVSRNNFQSNASTSWKSIGEINILSVLPLSRFLAAGNATTQSEQLGDDTVFMGSGETAPGLVQQIVAGVASKQFFMGLFGLSNRELYLYGHSRPTFLSIFKEYTLPSLSFSYTAGSFRNNTTPPSLVLGGFDASRFDSQSTLQVDITDNAALWTTYPFYVNLTSISFTGFEKTWPHRADSLGSVAIYIDSAIPQIWLPLSACQVFEDVFGLEWNDTAQLYLINSTMHDRLQRLNTTITLSLHSSRNGSTVRNFTLPYSAFDLKVTYPLVDIESFYFPPGNAHIR